VGRELCEWSEWSEWSEWIEWGVKDNPGPGLVWLDDQREPSERQGRGGTSDEEETWFAHTLCHASFDGPASAFASGPLMTIIRARLRG
jgi:hypothetical protein